ncbi:hypothetical protein BS78_05G275000 [Paspalum vaginatum]|nr:hypothetical protein BS78_05G275000 [Paspalum vaginatum]
MLPDFLLARAATKVLDVLLARTAPKVLDVLQARVISHTFLEEGDTESLKEKDIFSTEYYTIAASAWCFSGKIDLRLYREHKSLSLKPNSSVDGFLSVSTEHLLYGQ